jgi:hypothetical protein
MHVRGVSLTLITDSMLSSFTRQRIKSTFEFTLGGDKPPRDETSAVHGVQGKTGSCAS